jgi:glycosyltransferase involved in cell wall biosynthesis
MNQADWREFYGVGGSKKLPLVSIIAINWNYSAYLLTALESAVAQDYPALEIIALDNGSDDDSAALIEAFVKVHPQVRFIKLARNLGQLGAAHHILTEHDVSGEFVAFLDTDDFVFPHFISHHIRAHLLLDCGAGLSTSDVIQLDRNGTVVAGNMPQWWKSQPVDRPDWKRVTIETQGPAPQPLSLTTIGPNPLRWFCYPGTSNLYRRQAIDALVSVIQAPIEVKFALDASAVPFCHESGGTIVLNEPLSGYRIHGLNSSVTAMQLQHLDSGRASFGKSNRKQERWFRKAVKTFRKTADGKSESRAD